MKDKLTMEQSQKLIEIGIPRKNASEVFIIEGFMGNSYRPCFTLSDVLDLLPAALTKRLDNWPLTIKRHCKEQWSAGYGPIVMILEKELIDAAFGLIEWLNEEYDKPNAE